MDPMDERYDDYLDGDQRPPDQRTPPNTPPPQEEGEPGEGDGDLMQVDKAFHAAFAVNEHWTMPRNDKYEDTLCFCMAFAHNRDFPRYKKGTIFSRKMLEELKPQHIRNWLAQRAFHKVDYSLAAGDRPIHARSSAIEFAKKAVSFFMPDNAPQWCNGHGNPTKHQMHRTLINDIKTCEVRGEGAPSCVKRPLTMPEFMKQLEMIRKAGAEKQEFKFLYKYPAMMLWQYHLIARIDDVSNFAMASPMGHPQYSFCLKTKVQWSKNVKDEATCHPQLLLGSSDR